MCIFMMNDDIFDVHEGQLLCRLFRTVSVNEYNAKDAADDDRRHVKLRWSAYTDRQRRALRSLLGPAPAPASQLRDVHVYNLLTDGDVTAEKTSPPAEEVAAVTNDRGTTTGDRETTTADKETTTADVDEKTATAAREVTLVAAPKETAATEPEKLPRDRTDAEADADDDGSVVGPPETTPTVLPAGAGPNTSDGDGGSEADENRRHGGRHDRRSCVDLKSLAKLRRLCCMLRANVTELRDTYESRCGEGGGGGGGSTEATGRAFYTAAEHQALGDGLRALQADVSRLIGEVHDASGYRDEIADAVVAYKNYESRYRSLRALNKNARSRGTVAAVAADAATATATVTAEDVVCGAGHRDADGGYALRAWIRRYLCNPCYRLFRRFLPTDKDSARV